eukprot:scaffold109_cov252-Pinguiococcus_pyrenoidosus.AAC.23
MNESKRRSSKCVEGQRHARVGSGACVVLCLPSTSLTRVAGPVVPERPFARPFSGGWWPPQFEEFAAGAFSVQKTATPAPLAPGRCAFSSRGCTVARYALESHESRALQRALRQSDAPEVMSAVEAGKPGVAKDRAPASQVLRGLTADVRGSQVVSSAACSRRKHWCRRGRKTSPRASMTTWKAGARLLAPWKATTSPAASVCLLFPFPLSSQLDAVPEESRFAGEGNYGVVLKGISKSTGAEVALKMIKVDDTFAVDKKFGSWRSLGSDALMFWFHLTVDVVGFPQASLREIKALQVLTQVENVVKIHEVVSQVQDNRCAETLLAAPRLRSAPSHHNASSL